METQTIQLVTAFIGSLSGLILHLTTNHFLKQDKEMERRLDRIHMALDESISREKALRITRSGGDEINCNPFFEELELERAMKSPDYKYPDNNNYGPFLMREGWEKQEDCRFKNPESGEIMTPEEAFKTENEKDIV